MKIIISPTTNLIWYAYRDLVWGVFVLFSGHGLWYMVFDIPLARLALGTKGGIRNTAEDDVW